VLHQQHQQQHHLGHGASKRSSSRHRQRPVDRDRDRDRDSDDDSDEGERERERGHRNKRGASERQNGTGGRVSGTVPNLSNFKPRPGREWLVDGPYTGPETVQRSVISDLFQGIYASRVRCRCVHVLLTTRLASYLPFIDAVHAAQTA
jgi:hypothetical protein